MADANELAERLSAAVGMIMEDSSSIALKLDQACEDASALVQAAQVLARREIH